MSWAFMAGAAIAGFVTLVEDRENKPAAASVFSLCTIAAVVLRLLGF